jgi:hypothetical protein
MSRLQVDQRFPAIFIGFSTANTRSLSVNMDPAPTGRAHLGWAAVPRGTSRHVLSWPTSMIALSARRRTLPAAVLRRAIRPMIAPRFGPVPHQLVVEVMSALDQELAMDTMWLLCADSFRGT